MLRISCLIFVLVTSLRLSEARIDVNYRTSLDACQRKVPKSAHCYVEFTSKDRIPHTEMYNYNTLFRDCKLVRWAESICPLPTGDVNLFKTKEKCLQECSGIA